MNPLVIYHKSDYDGIFCREIARKFLPDATLIGWDFADAPIEIPADSGGKIYVLDLPIDRPFGFDFLKPETLPQPLDRICWSNFVWIDHHKSSIESHPKEIPGYRIDGVAACRLAWQWFTNGEPKHAALKAERLPCKLDYENRAVDEPIAVRLAGEYDIWDKRDPRAEVFQFGLRSQELNENTWDLMLVPMETHSDGKMDCGQITVDALLEAGSSIQFYQKHVDKGLMLSRGFDLAWEGLRFLCVNTGRFNSLTFESAVDPTKHDALLGFAWNGKKWIVSLYHTEQNKVPDLSAIATKYGGGGHRGACGFAADTLPFDLIQSKPL